MMFVKLICVYKFEMLNFAKRRIITELKCVVVGLHIRIYGTHIILITFQINQLKE